MYLYILVNIKLIGSEAILKPKLISSLVLRHTYNCFQSLWNQCNDSVGKKIVDVFNAPKGTAIAEGTLQKDLRPM